MTAEIIINGDTAELKSNFAAFVLDEDLASQGTQLCAVSAPRWQRLLALDCAVFIPVWLSLPTPSFKV